MSARNVWTLGIALLALVLTGTAVVMVGGSVRDAQWREESRKASLAPASAQASPGDTGVARGGATPKGQKPATALSVPRFLDAFNAEASDRRLLVLLSPT